MEKNINIWAYIVECLQDKSLTIATMESCTGGGVANEITNISGASNVLRESFVTYCNEAKVKRGVPEAIINKYSVYSPETALEMAKAAKKQAKSDIGIGTTGLLGRTDPNNSADKVNCAWFAIVDQNDKIVVREISIPNEERKVQKDFFIEEIAKTLIMVIS